MSCVVELLRSWSHPRAVALTAIAISAAGCSSETLRFNDNPFSRRARRARSPAQCRPSTAPVSRVESSSLPPPAASRPVTTAAAPAPRATEPQAGAGACLLPPRARARSRKSPARCKLRRSRARRAGAATQWSWDGGTAVTVGRGETVDSIAHRHGVPRRGDPAGQQSQRRPGDLSRPAAGDPALQSGGRASGCASRPCGR